MKLTFIGTSHGVPEPTRRCSCTMLEIAGKYYFIDMGTQAMEDIHRRGIDIHDVKGVFLTHAHGDHTDGIISFVDLINWYYKNANPTIFFPRESMIEALKSWISAIGTSNMPLRDGLNLRVVKEGLLYDDGTMRVTAIPTLHCPQSYAYYVEAEGKNILFTGDLAHPTKDFPQIAFERELDLIVCESAHFDTASTEAVLNRTKAKNVILNHIPAYRDADIFNVLQNEHRFKLQKSNDGMEFTL